MVTNGEVTERQYFVGLEKELGNVVIEVRSFRRDPCALAALARDLKGKEASVDQSQDGRGIDGYQRVFVVTDVDNFTAKQFQDAQRICREEDVELIVSNPCFEVWLIDHLMCCPDAYSEPKATERKAAELGIVGGSRDKHVIYPIIEGKRDQACENAARHNTQERRLKRSHLSSLGFAPWTDMPVAIKRLEGKKG